MVPMRRPCSEQGKRDFVSQSTPEPAEDRVVLFQNRGELSEFAHLLSELAVAVEERSGRLPTPTDLEGARLVVVSGRSLLESGAPNLSLWPRTIAVIDDSSRTLVSHLSRIGAAMVIRRPIHPRALRLLLLHEIYRGPERRGRRRILIGHPIRVTSGLFRPQATLLELSSTGARIELPSAPKVGTKMRILIGKDLTKGKPIKLQARVVRSIRSAGDSSRTGAEVGVALIDAIKHARVLKGILDRFALGPASMNTKGASNEVSSSNVASATNQTTAPVAAERPLPPSRGRTLLPPAHGAGEVANSVDPIAPDIDPDDSTATATEAEETVVETANVEIAAEEEAEANAEASKSVDAEETSSTKGSDRHQQTRIPYDRRIVALGEEAARVLVGRDLSRGGMRIAATPAVSVGDVLRVALHSGTQTEPTVVIARAQRDDGEDGLVLRFDDLSESQTDQLEKIIASSLPVRPSTDEFADVAEKSDTIVVAEMIETIDTADRDDEMDGGTIRAAQPPTTSRATKKSTRISTQSSIQTSP